MNPQADSSFGPYRLTEKLGAGGMGTVWRALDTRLERHVALKFLSPSEADDPTSLARFRRESVAVTRLNHPNIMTVYEAGSIDGTPYLCSELVEGKNLKELAASGGLTECAVIEYGLQLLSALGAAHSLGIIHRDIKPLNVMVRPDGVLKLLDFGIARREEDPGLSLPGKLIGTPRYMAPERLKGREAEPSSDLFSVGALMYELLSGRPAFAGRGLHQVIQSILNDSPRPLLPQSGLTQVVHRALEKDPTARFTSALAMAEALRACRKGEPLDSLTVDILEVSGPAPRILAPPVSGPEGLLELADGIHTEANSKLGLEPKVKLISPFAYRDKGELSLDQAERLGADFILESKVRGSVERLRFYLSLVRVQGGEQIWSDSLEAGGGSTFDLEDECVDWLLEKVCEYFGAPPGEDQGTHEESLRLAVSDYRPWDADAVTKTQAGLEELLKRAPDFGLVHGRLALVLVESLRFRGADRGKVRARALQLAQRSLELSPEQPYGYLALSKACVGAGQADWKSAWTHLAEAFKLGSDNLEVHAWRAFFDVQTGRPERAVQRAQALLVHEPESPEMLTVLSIGWLCTGEFHRALEVAEKLLRLRRGDSMALCLVFLADLCLGRQERALRFASFLRRKNEELVAKGIADPILAALLFVADALEGKPGPKDSRLILSARGPARMALTGYAIQNDEDGVKMALSRLLELGFRNTPFLMNDPNLKGFSQRSWFIDTVTEMEKCVAATA